jgi:hypothetical protein
MVAMTTTSPSSTSPVVTRVAAAAAIAQVVFVLSWLVAALWQGPRYSAVAHSVSDMYAVGAPHAWFLIVVLTATGAMTIVFALWALRPALRGGGWSGTAGSILLALSVLGLGDLLSIWEREACRRADPGCTPAAQLANAGGRLDGVLTTIGLMLLIVAGFFLAVAASRVAGWQRWAWPMRIGAIVVAVLLLATGLFGPIGGLLERLLALAAAAGVFGLAVLVLRGQRPGRVTA